MPAHVPLRERACVRPFLPQKGTKNRPRFRPRAAAPKICGGRTAKGGLHPLSALDVRYLPVQSGPAGRTARHASGPFWRISDTPSASRPLRRPRPLEPSGLQSGLTGAESRRPSRRFSVRCAGLRFPGRRIGTRMPAAQAGRSVHEDALHGYAPAGQPLLPADEPFMDLFPCSGIYYRKDKKELLLWFLELWAQCPTKWISCAPG